MSAGLTQAERDFLAAIRAALLRIEQAQRQAEPASGRPQRPRRLYRRPAVDSRRRPAPPPPRRRTA